VRAHAEAWTHWIDDHRRLVDLVCSPGASTAAAGANLELSPDQRAALTRVPIFLAGESLGGAHALALGLRLQQEADDDECDDGDGGDGDGGAAGGDDGGDRAGGDGKSSGAVSVARRFSGACLVSAALFGPAHDACCGHCGARCSALAASACGLSAHCPLRSSQSRCRCLHRLAHFSPRLDYWCATLCMPVPVSHCHHRLQLAPAVKGNLPPAPVVALLRYLVVPIMPQR
jgi:hypothetical protein